MVNNNYLINYICANEKSIYKLQQLEEHVDIDFFFRFTEFH